MTSGKLSAETYIEKSSRALQGAQALLAVEDYEGACSRAYYAMFDAAHAALLAAGITTPESSSKTHRSLIASFGLNLVKSGAIAPELGSAINKVERLRRLADYTGEPIEAADATWSVGKASELIAAVRDLMHISDPQSRPPDPRP
ncbi:HEPN domain-containing protein [Burkholderia guangdongensis]|uniref:HEPN domain-containing protein n=1 Tax=Burkholderia guangdongensis TaxID=1792500 RepID=UPI0015CE61E2|nr:HEPN domain-containing protein [Burkholderia guangdongensis]